MHPGVCPWLAVHVFSMLSKAEGDVTRSQERDLKVEFVSWA